MGRLTLNVLLSFAQFEREVTAERIRDKVAASKRKGLWVGGMVPLGYELKERGKRNDDDDGEDCEIGPKARDGDRTGRCEQCDGRADHERACLEVSRDGHQLVFHLKENEVPSRLTLQSKHLPSHLQCPLWTNSGTWSTAFDYFVGASE